MFPRGDPARIPASAAAHAGLAGVLEELGDFDGSHASLREALRHDPRHAGALARLATRLRDKLSASPTGPRSRACWPIPACRLTGAGRSCSAWPTCSMPGASSTGPPGSLAEANALQLADFEARGRGYDPAAHHSFVDRLIAAFTPEFFERCAAFGPGNGAAGLRRRHAAVGHDAGRADPGEPPPGLWGGRAATGPADVRGHSPSDRPRSLPLDCLAHLDRSALRSWPAGTSTRCRAQTRSADRVVDKMPENTLYLGLIAALFPRARLIHCRRDPRDVALSCWMTHFAEIRWACDPHHIASRSAEYHRVMDHWRRVLPVPIFEVRLRSDGRRPGGRVAGACGLVRPGVGPGLPRVPRDPAPRADRERRPGPPADLQQLDRPLEELRAVLCRAVRRARERRVSAEWDSSGEGPRSRFGLLFDVDDPCSRFGFVLSFGVRGKMHYHGRATASIALWGTASGC